MASNIEIYTKDYCPYCTMAKDYFRNRNLEFTEIDLSKKPDELATLKERTHHMTVPQIFVDGEFIGGYTDMVARLKQGTLRFS